jgi:hypothetical protein
LKLNVLVMWRLICTLQLWKCYV